MWMENEWMFPKSRCHTHNAYVEWERERPPAHSGPVLRASEIWNDGRSGDAPSNTWHQAVPSPG